MAKNVPATHHWWPKGLQRHWADKHGSIYWVDPSGKTHSKKNLKKIGSKIHGHTLFKNSVWESNFENEFSVDNEVNRIIGALLSLKPFGRNPREFIKLLSLFFKKDRDLIDMCNFYKMEEKLHRDLLALLCSLAMRSPAHRFKYERTGADWGFPPSEDLGKMNMLQSFLAAKKLFDNGSLSGHKFVILHSPIKKFYFGDGMFDTLDTGRTIGIGGRILAPLTPNICVYFCATTKGYNKNTVSLSVPSWMVDLVNEITQIYSGNTIFFSGRKPKISDNFKSGKFLRHNYRKDYLINILDDLVGVQKPNPDLLRFFDGKA